MLSGSPGKHDSFVRLTLVTTWVDGVCGCVVQLDGHGLVLKYGRVFMVMLSF